MRTNYNRSGERKGFTLIELLIVIAIIAILASILFPVFARVRENARRTSCASNLKQIGLAFFQYAQDYDETYPKAFAYNSNTFTSTNSGCWDTEIQKYMAANVSYIKRAAIFQCPSDALPRTGTGGFPRSYAMTAAYVNANNFWSYTATAACETGDPLTTKVGKLPDGFSGETEADDQNFCYSRGRRVSEIVAPAETLEVTEMVTTFNVMSFVNHGVVLRPVSSSKAGCSGGVTLSSPNCGQDGQVDPLHFDGWNYLFADGHVKWLKPEQTVGTGKPSSPKGYWTIAEGD